MAKPNFGNLNRFATRCTTSARDNIIIKKQEAQGIVHEYQRMLVYVVELQDRIIELQNEVNTPHKVEIKAPEF